MVPSAVFLKKTALGGSGSLYTNWRTALVTGNTKTAHSR
jgi:hypothetical protein